MKKILWDRNIDGDLEPHYLIRRYGTSAVWVIEHGGARIIPDFDNCTFRYIDPQAEGRTGAFEKATYPPPHTHYDEAFEKAREYHARGRDILFLDYTKIQQPFVDEEERF